MTTLPPVIEHRNWHPASLLDGAGAPDIRRMSQAAKREEPMEPNEHLEARNKSLIEMDFDFMRNRLGIHASDHMCELVLHKARYECTTIPAEFRHASGAWLRERGYRRMTGSPLLPEGQLPL